MNAFNALRSVTRMPQPLNSSHLQHPCLSDHDHISIANHHLSIPPSFARIWSTIGIILPWGNNHPSSSTAASSSAITPPKSNINNCSRISGSCSTKINRRKHFPSNSGMANLSKKVYLSRPLPFSKRSLWITNTYSSILYSLSQSQWSTSQAGSLKSLKCHSPISYKLNSTPTYSSLQMISMPCWVGYSLRCPIYKPIASTITTSTHQVSTTATADTNSPTQLRPNPAIREPSIKRDSAICPRNWSRL